MSNQDKPLQTESLALIADRFKVLGDPLRLRLLHLMNKGERSVSDLVEASSANQANVSKHLQILLRAGLVARRKDGLKAFYQIKDPSIFELCNLVCGRLSEQYEADLSAIARLNTPSEDN